MNKIFKYDLDISYLGGNAIIVAENEKEAYKILKKEDGRINRKNILEIEELDLEKGIKFYWDGDY